MLGICIGGKLVKRSLCGCEISGARLAVSSVWKLVRLDTMVGLVTVGICVGGKIMKLGTVLMGN